MLFDTRHKDSFVSAQAKQTAVTIFDSTMHEFTEPKVIALPLLVLVECVHGGISVPCAKDTWAIASKCEFLV